jgi:DNA polymerase III subunit epsilon
MTLCTMRASRPVVRGGCSLTECCGAFGISLAGAHRAGVDALATAELLAALIANSRRDDWTGLMAGAPVLSPYPADRAPWIAREDVPEYSPSFLERITERVPDVSETDEQAEYLALVQRCLLDRYLSEHEMAALIALADRHGISRTTAAHLHREYFIALAAVAWEDGIVSETERDDLLHVASLLQVPDEVVILALREPVTLDPDSIVFETRGFAVAPGDAIVLTGDMRRERSEWETKLREFGFVPKDAVSRKVRIVVAADPDSLSGKARKARDLGIPIVGEDWLDAMFG